MALKAQGIILLAVCVGAVMASAGPAQDVLGDLAASERSARLLAGTTYIGIGLAVGVGSAIYLMGTEYGAYGLLAGGLIAAPGVITLLIPTAAEREFATAGDSEQQSALALERLADQGRRDRYISGVSNVAAGIGVLFFPFRVLTPYDSLYSAVSSFGMAIYDFFVPSAEEQAWQRYERLAGQQP